jgi:hypothetical protein
VTIVIGSFNFSAAACSNFSAQTPLGASLPGDTWEPSVLKQAGSVKAMLAVHFMGNSVCEAVWRRAARGKSMLLQNPGPLLDSAESYFNPAAKGIPTFP